MEVTPRLLLLLLALISVKMSAQQKLPNIILILADDMGYGDPSCYNDSSLISTVHIDQLAKNGMRFTDAHTPSSVCTPTRYGILTGRYSWRTSLKKGVLWSWDGPLIAPDRLTLPGMLQRKGYHTACIGKWHLGWEWQDHAGKPLVVSIEAGNFGQDQREQIGKLVDLERPVLQGPVTRGFDYYFGDDVPNFPPYAFIENDRVLGKITSEKPEDMFGHPGPAMPGWDLSMVLPRLAQEGSQYIEERSRHPGEPFFLYLPLTAPHTPIAPTPHFIGSTKAGWYGDFVKEVDWVVGQIVEALTRTGQKENTLIIFTSDNGSPQRDGSNMNGETGSVTKLGHNPSRPWRGMKGDIWEGGHRVPFIVSWPGHIPQDTVTDDPLILVDLMRTIAELTEVSLSESQAEDSFNMLPVWLGEQTEKPVRNHLIHHSHQGVFAIRQGTWKLILGQSSGGFTKYTPPANAPSGQLYNLEEDPAEQYNLYRQHPEEVSRLNTLLENYQKQGYTFTRE